MGPRVGVQGLILPGITKPSEMLSEYFFAFGQDQAPNRDPERDRAGSEGVAPAPLKIQHLVSTSPQGATERKEPMESTVLPS